MQLVMNLFDPAVLHIAVDRKPEPRRDVAGGRASAELLGRLRGRAGRRAGIAAGREQYQEQPTRQPSAHTPPLKCPRISPGRLIAIGASEAVQGNAGPQIDVSL